MGLVVKFGLPLIGIVVLCGLVACARPGGEKEGYEDVNSLPPEEKRRIIRELLRAQRDIRQALLKIHYHLDGDEIEEDEEDEYFGHGCWDKELAGYRQNTEEKMASLTNAVKEANHVLDEIEERLKRPVDHGHYGGYYPGPGYGHHGYGPIRGRPTEPPIITTPEPVEPSNPASSLLDEEEYYARHLPVAGSRRYGRLLQEQNEQVSEENSKVDKPQEPYSSDVAEALETLAEDKE
ncbi:uncharacterized protein LOC131215506 [Anopheles bellator]|uniref:uncharacterized protein LOC131215506 n=1 Tax=Anopheles bellator TaxID=139047 RepID=UPI0026480AAE|nr:uncharacterized protein LOC131215506 [Anopheles bellator]